MATNKPAGSTTMRQPIVCCAIDDVALASLRQPPQQRLECSLCDCVIDGQPAGSGLFLWTRGDEVRFDEPPLCRKCATAVGVTAFHRWACEEECE